MCFRPPSINKQKPKKCPACGTLNPPNLNVCKKCNNPLPEEEQAKQAD